MRCIMRWWHRRKKKRHHHHHLRLTIGQVTIPFQGDTLMATLALTDIQHCPLAISAVDAAGNPAPLPAGAVTWASSNPSVATVTPAADGMSADVAAAGPLGTAQISVSVAVDASTTLTGTLDVTVGASAAATIQIAPGTPVNK